ncbi:integrase [Salmonella enterica subsp. enterica serovar Senftenberg str. 361154004]|nr:integrase [Salmonella enterica subsp. enterica serovar Senftenberg str. 361154004]
MHDKRVGIMPKKARELSALAVSRLKAEGRYAVSGVDGLYLRIAGRSRAWGLIYMLIDYIKFCKGGFCF